MWTNNDVTVELPTQTGYTTVYSTTGIPTVDSTKYSGSFPVKENCKIYYAYSDGVNVGSHGTLNITNIDKEGPVISSLSADKTANTMGPVKLTAVVQDSMSGIVAIAWSNSAVQPTETSSTFAMGKWFEINVGTALCTRGLTGNYQNADYYFWVKDYVGNVSHKLYTVSNIVNWGCSFSPYYDGNTGGLINDGWPGSSTDKGYWNSGGYSATCSFSFDKPLYATSVTINTIADTWHTDYTNVKFYYLLSDGVTWQYMGEFRCNGGEDVTISCGATIYGMKMELNSGPNPYNTWVGLNHVLINE